MIRNMKLWKYEIWNFWIVESSESGKLVYFEFSFIVEASSWSEKLNFKFLGLFEASYWSENLLFEISRIVEASNGWLKFNIEFLG